MRATILTLVAAGFACAAFTAPAAARDYPYCLQGRSLGIPGECSYSSYDQCMASASGRNLSCNINPRVAFARERGGQQGYQPRAYRGEGFWR